MYDHLVQFATVRQIEFIDALKLHKTARAAGRALGVDHKTIITSLNSLEIKAARKQPTTHDYSKNTVPDGFGIKGVSQYIKDGEVKGQWVKTSVDAERQLELMKLAVEALTADVKPLPMVTPPRHTESELLNVIPMGDPHFGLQAWGRESGEDFDLKIAESMTLGAVDRLIQSCPKAKTCIILPLGDIFHANDQKNVTPGHGHQLDVDSRYQKIMMVGVLTFRHAIIRALETHQNVVVRFVKGNHDPEASFGLAVATAAFFHDNPRVTVDLSPSAFWYYKHGKTLIGSTHGDTVKHEALLGVMASDKAEWWGQTKHRYWYTGHVHSQNVREYPGVICESFRTLAAKDAYTSGHGYRAGRDMLCITHHVEHGEIERHRCDIGMIKG